jgi:dynactin complex subunit
MQYNLVFTPVFLPLLIDMTPEQFLCIGTLDASQLFLQAAFLSSIRHLHSFVRYHHTRDYDDFVDVLRVRKQILAQRSPSLHFLLYSTPQRAQIPPDAA